jgi:subtilisin family serine protease
MLEFMNGRLRASASLLTSATLVLLAITPETGAADRATVSPWVEAATAAGSTAEILVVLADQADLREAAGKRDLSARRHAVRDALWEAAQRSQAPLRAWLDARGIAHRPFYIVNALLVPEADTELVSALASRPDVVRIEANPWIRQALPRPRETDGGDSPTAIEWNVSLVAADRLWEAGITGEGIVVGNQDTGFDWDHPALRDQYRGWNGTSADHDYSWHDAVHSGGGLCGPDSPVPCDDYGHGTMTLGVSVGGDGGANRIGVAPGARWIGCRNMDQGWGSPATYLECLEFFLAPYPVGGTPADGNPDRAPHVTNNSWTCPPDEGCSWDTLAAAVEAHRAAGILTVAAAGNGGPSCSTVEDPIAIYDAVFSVGATDIGDAVASFSSRGPVTVDGSLRLKPDLAAPGDGIRSSAPGGDYGSASGTSLAAPHVAGAVALLWSASPALRGRVDATESILGRCALPRTSSQCGDPGDVVPNNVYGWGRLDVMESWQVFADGFDSGGTSAWSSAQP